MFYEGLGLLLRRAADVLDRPSSHGDDERAQRQLRMLTSLVRRCGVVLPMTFAAVGEELLALQRTRSDVRERLLRVGHPPRDLDDDESSTDPLVRLRSLYGQLDEYLVELLTCDQDDPEVLEARRVLRAGLREAVEIEGRIVDAMLAA